MTPERWRRVSELFDAALRLPSAERAAHLANVCGDDVALQREVQSLLDSDDQASRFLRDATIAPPRELVSDLTGRRIGPWLVRRRLATGGMGSVWLGDRADEQFSKTVAIKVIKRGMDTEAIVRRFHHERQVLAGLDHPYVARLLDGGATDDGLPYLVMEYVEGVPIDEYCDEQMLAVNDRVRLFRKVCEAVQFAHRNLIVHRDLKPGNILVTADGTPKLLDFGIAKVLHAPDALTRSLTMTEPGAAPMTPEYASPEQIRGNAVTTQSDVYALGVILYELLCGQRPHITGDRGLTELQRAICDDEPRRPSTVIERAVEIHAADVSIRRDAYAVSTARRVDPRRLRRRLSGDLDTIVLMALRKEPTRRYASVEQFSEDLRRHLAGLPVIARADTIGYRASKFLRRHAVPVSLLTALVVSLATFAGVTAWQAAALERQRSAAVAASEKATAAGEVAQRERDRARVAAAKSENIAAYLRNMLAGIDPDTARDRDTTILREILADAEKSIDQRLADQPEVRAAIHYTIGETYRKIGRFADARRNLEASLQLHKQLAGERSLDVAMTLAELASLARDEGDYDKALPMTKQALDLLRQSLDDDSSELAAQKGNLALVLLDTGDLTGAERLFREALATQRRLLGEDAPLVLGAENNLALLLKRIGKFDDARELYQSAIDGARRSFGTMSPRLALYQANLAALQESLDEADAAEQNYRAAIAIQREVFKQGHGDLAVSLDNLGRLLASRGRPREAEPLVREALAMFRKDVGDDHPDVLFCMANLAGVLRALGQPTEAERLARIAYDGVRKQLGDEHPQTAMIGQALASALRELGRHDEALTLMRASLKLARAQLGDKHPYVVQTMRATAIVLAAMGDHAAARQMLDEAARLGEAILKPDDARLLDIRSRLAQELIAIGNAGAAEPIIRDVLRRREATLAARHELIQDARCTLGECLTALGRFDEARAALDEASQPPSFAAEPATWSEPRVVAARLALAEKSRMADEAAALRARLNAIASPQPTSTSRPDSRP